MAGYLPALTSLLLLSVESVKSCRVIVKRLGLPVVEPALQNPAKVIHNLMHSLWTASNGVGRGAEPRPPVLNSGGRGVYTPQKNIFPKVRSSNMQLDLQLYCM